MNYYIGLDLGTSSIKLGIIDEQNTICYQNKISNFLLKKGLEAEQEPEKWWLNVKQLISQIPKNFKSQIRAIAFAGQMHSMVALDRNNQVLRNAILWNDTRTFQEVKEINNFFTPQQLIKKTGNIAIEGFTAPKILWFYKNQRSLFNQTNKFLMPKDFIAFKMSGIFATDYSDASGTLYFNQQTNAWFKEMLDFLHLKEKQLPKIYHSSDVIGVIKSNLAREFELPKDTKIVIGGADNAISAVANGVINERLSLISIGTSGTVYVPSLNFKTSLGGEFHTFKDANNNFYNMGVTLAAGESLRWWAKQIAQVTANNFKTIKPNSILFLPHLAGERTPFNNPFALGAFAGLRYEHQKEDLDQAVIEGVAFSLLIAFKSLLSENKQVNKTFLTGGGSNNEYLKRILASLLNHRIYWSNNKYETFFGACLVAKAASRNLNLIDLLKTVNFDYQYVKPFTKAEKSYLKRKLELWSKFYKQLEGLNYQLYKSIEMEQ